MNILLVEDNKAISKALKYNLEQNKFNILIAETIKDALKILKSENI